MVNYNDPAVVLLDSCAWPVVLAHGKLKLLFFTGALVKLCHAVDSLYLLVFPRQHLSSPSLISIFRSQLGVFQQS
jgi:hypothetical protein